MSQGTSTLLYGVRAQVLGHYLSRFALVLAALTLVPFAVALMWRDTTLSLRLGVTALVLVALGWPGLRLPPPRRLQVNEAAVIVALTFLVTPLLMAWSMAGAGLAPVDALFEAVSAVTTTGLTTLKSVEDMPPAFLFLRAWMQWYGGLGIAALSVALIMGHNAAARRLSQPQGSDDLATTARTHARQVLIAYVALTLLGFAILWAVLGHGYQALVHMLATVSTGGFSAYDTSLQEMPDLPAYVITVFSVLGALPFVLYYQLAAGRIRETRNDDELRALAFALALVIAVLSAALAWDMDVPWTGALREATLLGVSAQTTTGFSHLDVSSLSPLVLVVVIVSMLIGGSVGSSAGGIKLFRVIVVWHMLRTALRRTAMPPHAVTDARAGGRKLEPEDLERVLLMVMLFVVTVALSWMAFLADGHAPLPALFEVSSAVGTVGLSAGVTSHELEWPLKLILCADMWLGRLEILAILVLLYPPTWLSRRAEI